LWFYWFLEMGVVPLAKFRSALSNVIDCALRSLPKDDHTGAALERERRLEVFYKYYGIAKG
jgi:hypothetical protein